MLRVVARRQPRVPCDLLLHLVEHLLTDDAWNGQRNPFVPRAGALALARPHGAEGRLAPLGGDSLRAIAIGRARVGGVPQDAPDTGAVPGGLAPRRRDPFPRQACRDLPDRAPVLHVPGEHPRDDTGLIRVHAERGRVTGMLRVAAVAEGRRAPGQELAGPHLRQPSTAGALGDQGPLIRGDRPPYLQQ